MHFSVFFVLLACVRLRKLQGVAISASEEGGPGPGLPDTGEQEKQPAPIPIQTHVQIHTTLYPPSPPASLLTDASCPAAQSTVLHTYKHT